MKRQLQLRAPLISTLLLFLLGACSTPPSSEQSRGGKIDCDRIGEIMDDVAKRGRIKNADDLRAFEKSGVQSPRGVDAFGDRTLPKHNTPQEAVGTFRDPTAPGLDEATSNAYRREKEALNAMGEKGYKVQVLPEKKNGGNGYGRLMRDGTKPGNPDALVNENRVFEVYSPTSDKLMNVASTIQDKVYKQSQRIMLNLDGFSRKTEELVKYIEENPVDELLELMVYRDGNFSHYFPF